MSTKNVKEEPEKCCGCNVKSINKFIAQDKIFYVLALLFENNKKIKKVCIKKMR